MSYTPNFINPIFDDLGTPMFDFLWHELYWVKLPDAPRREYWTNSLGRSYTYGKGIGRRTYANQPSHPAIERVSDALESHLGFRYSGCFLNGYKDGRDSLGWHSDDDPGIDHNYPIAVVSVYCDGPGGFRSIQVKPIAGDKIETIVLENGSLFLMEAGSQFTHRHRIAKAGFIAKPRISLTFRMLIP